MADVVTPEKAADGFAPDALTQLQTSAADLIAWLKSGADQGADFVMEQAPLLAQEIVAWEIWSNAASVVLLLLAAALVSVAARRFQDWMEPGDRANRLGIMLSWFMVMGFIAAFVAFNLYDMIRPIVAPRLVILEKAAELLR